MNFFKNKLTVTIIVLSVVFLLLIAKSIKRDNLSYVENGVGVTLNSIQGLINKVNYRIKDVGTAFFTFSDVKKENEELKKKVNDLENKALQYDDLKNENDRLRDMLNFKNQTNEFNYIGSDIIGKSGGSFIDGFIINKGSSNGVKTRMVVITANGLVGQVTSVASNFCVVQSLANENIAVSAIVQTTRENNGIVKGFKDSENKQLAKIYYLPMDSKIEKGDVIMTSGLGGLYPKGIKIGSVLSIEEDKGKVMKTAIINPYVDFNKLEEVFVVVPKNNTDINYSGE